MSTIGDNLRIARKALKMSQDDLADAIGANRVTISKYENGIYLPSVPALERLADALNTTSAQLRGEAEEPKTEDVPKTREARIVSGLMDKLPLENREQIVNVVYAMCKNRPELFEGENENDA